MDSADIEEFCKKEHPVVAVLCIPTEYAAENADKLVSLGIKGFWNGFKGWVAQCKRRDASSSIIYVFRKRR